MTGILICDEYNNMIIYDYHSPYTKQGNMICVWPVSQFASDKESFSSGSTKDGSHSKVVTGILGATPPDEQPALSGWK